jgi:hypothetical protein
VVTRLPRRKVDVQAFLRVYLHLQSLAEAFPAAIPEGGIKLAIQETRGDLGHWDDRERYMTLPSRYYGTTGGLMLLAVRLAILEQIGHTPKGCSSPEYVITHELGHCLRHRLDGPRYARWWSGADRTGLGAKGAQSYSEGFAEAFAIMQHVPEEQWPNAVKVLHRMLREDGVL